MIVLDTSVTVPVALPGHVHHERARAALPAGRTRLLAHVALETYSVLTRLPNPHRFLPSVVLDFLRQQFGFPPAEPERGSSGELLGACAGQELLGGAIYDALVALTAKQLGATLLTLDRRAVRTYELLGTDFRLVG